MTKFISKLTVGDIEITFKSNDGCCTRKKEIAALAEKHWWVWRLLAEYCLPEDEDFRKEVEVMRRQSPGRLLWQTASRYQSFCFDAYRFHHHLVKYMLENEIPFTLIATSRDG